MNDTGDVVAPSMIAGPGVTDDNNAVLWLRHRVLDRWVPLLRSGTTQIDGRTVYAEDAGDLSETYYWQTGGADGDPQSLNDAGTLVASLEFTDGTNGVYLISPPIFGDADQDGDLDFVDWALMPDCWTGPDEAAAPDCAIFDLDADGDIDLVDQQMLQALFTGES